LFAGQEEQFYTEQDMGYFFKAYFNNPPDDRFVIVKKGVQLPLISGNNNTFIQHTKEK